MRETYEQFEKRINRVYSLAGDEQGYYYTDALERLRRGMSLTDAHEQAIHAEHDKFLGMSDWREF